MRISDWDWSGDDDTPTWERVLVGLRDGAFMGAEGGVRRRGLVSVNGIERRPAHRGDLDPLGQTPRMRLHLRDGRAIDVLPASDTLDRWLADLRESYAWWFRRAREEAPAAVV